MNKSSRLRRRWTNNKIVVFPTAILSEKISPSALRLWIALAQFANDERQCWPSRRTLLELLPEGTAKSTLRKARAELEEHQLLEVEYRTDPHSGRETSPLYTLLVPVSEEDDITPHEESETDSPSESETERPKNLNNELNKKEDVDEIKIVFDKWIEATEKSPTRTKLDEKRRSTIRKALKSHSLQDVCDAVVGWKREPFYCGQNDRKTVYNSLKLLLRDADQIEKFRDLEREATLVDTKPKKPKIDSGLIGMVLKESDGTPFAKYNAETGKWDNV